jgi:hypothetical protein
MSSFSIAAGRPARRRPRSYWLFASVAVNLILIGLIFSWALGMRAHQPMFGWQRDLVGSLSPADAAIVGNATDRLEEVQARTDRLLVDQYEALKTVLRARPFSPGDCQKVLDQMAFIRDDQQISFQRIFAEEAAALSPEGRAALVDAMEREAHRWHPPWH